MKRTLFFDVDGILLDFSGPFADYWNQGLNDGLWEGGIFERNPSTWNLVARHDKDDVKVMYEALHKFHENHEHLPLLHDDIALIMTELNTRYNIELVSAYPHESRRMDNLIYHNIPYDKLICNTTDKLSYIKERERQGIHVVAIFEDGPQNLDKLLLYYGNKIWAPNYWRYLESYKNISDIRMYSSPQEWKEL